jgi:hypothetical protein
MDDVQMLSRSDRLPQIPRNALCRLLRNMQYRVRLSFDAMKLLYPRGSSVYDQVVRLVQEFKLDPDDAQLDKKMVSSYRSFIINASLANSEYLLQCWKNGSTYFSELDHWTTFYMDVFAQKVGHIFLQLYEHESGNHCFAIIDTYTEEGRARMGDRVVNLYRGNTDLEDEFPYGNTNCWERYIMYEDREDSSESYTIKRFITFDIMALRIQRVWRQWRQKKIAARIIWKHWQFVTSNPYLRLGRNRFLRDMDIIMSEVS